MSDDVYQGPEVEGAPDVIVRSTTHQVDNVMTDVIFRRREHNGHAPEGMYAIDGPDVTGDGTTANIVDIAPTVLSLLEAGVPTNMDGEVLDELFEEPLQPEYIPPEVPERRTGPDDAVDDSDVKGRLADLGYLDG